MSNQIDDTRDPAQHGYQRVASGDTGGGGGTLSTSTTGTSLDLMIVDETAPTRTPTFPLSRQKNPSNRTNMPLTSSNTGYQPIDDSQRFTPIFEGDDFNDPPIEFIQTQQQLQKHQQQQQQFRQPLNIQQQQQKSTSKSSLKGSRVSFEQKAADTDDDSFEDKRDQYQQQRTVSGVDHKGILKDLKHIMANDDRKAFQSKKHVSLDVKGTFLEDLLKDSSSDEEFHKTRKEFQGRKHQSLDPRVNLKALLGQTSSSDEDGDDKQSLIHRDRRYKDTSRPIIIDLKDFESDDEDFIARRKSFQQQKQQSMESKKSLRFFEMDEIGSKKNKNLRNAVPFVRQITEDGKPKLEVYCPTTNPIYLWSQVLAAIAVSLGSLVVGFTAAYTSPALVSMVDRNITSFSVSRQQASWVGGLMPLAGLAGGILGGPLIEYFGRKNTILATAPPFITAWLLIACAVNVSMVLAGRALSGLCVGIASLALPVYLGESLQPEVRGTLGLLPTALGNIGILFCFVAGAYLDWSHLAFLGATLPIPFLLLMFFIPETPRWFIGQGREDRARKALIWLRGRKADVEPEMKSIVETHIEAQKNSSKHAMLDLMKKSNLKPLSISLGLMFFQQLSGINAVIFYTVQIFKDAGSTIDGNVCTIIVGAVNFVAIFIATVLIDKLGRKILLYISAIAMFITLFVLGAFFYCKHRGMDVSDVGWIPLASFVIYVLGFSMGFGPIPWLMMGEILPGKIRGSAASVATGFNWTCTFVVTKTFQDLQDLIGAHGAFWLFGVICLIGLFFVIFCVPETQGKSLEEIERRMMGPVRRMSSVANMKPLSSNL